MLSILICTDNPTVKFFLYLFYDPSFDFMLYLNLDSSIVTENNFFFLSLQVKLWLFYPFVGLVIKTVNQNLFWD